MTIIYKIIQPEVVYALGTMLVNFLWQALVLALFLGFFLVLTRKSNPVPRYYAAVFSMFLLPIMAFYTFISALRSIEVEMLAHPEFASEPGKILSNQNLMEKFVSIYTSYIPLIVFLWFIGISALILKNLGGLILIQRLKSIYIEPVNDSIKQMIEQVKQNFLIRKTILPLFSLKVSTPMVIGHFKPVILIPRVLAQHLSPDELKIVLQHELAHIKRNDF